MRDLVQIRTEEFQCEARVLSLRRAVFEQKKQELVRDLIEAEGRLRKVSEERALEETKSPATSGMVVGGKPETGLLGKDTTGLEVKIGLRMDCVPGSLVHLFTAADQPLLAVEIFNYKDKPRRLRLVSFVEGYSAHSVDTIEVEARKSAKVNQLPTFFPERLRTVTELTRATLHVEVRDLDVDAGVEVEKTTPIWIMARTTAPLEMRDPATGAWKDVTSYFGAFVTPNAPLVMGCLREAAAKHPHGLLSGYQGKVEDDVVTPQVRAVFDALKERGLAYVHSIIQFTPSKNFFNQRVRLPQESLEHKSANCIDGVLLMASLLEAASLNPALVIIPGHAFLAWETWEQSKEWVHLETTLIPSATFDEARARGEELAKAWKEQDATLFKRRSIRDLRAQGIFPIE